MVRLKAASGQVLLIADETAYPALVGILENWKNQIHPVVILISAKKDEQNYFSEETLPQSAQVHRVVCSEQE